jgi:hypothetical protein
MTATVAAKPFYDPNKKIAASPNELLMQTPKEILVAEQKGLQETYEKSVDIHL